ncbi:hypothetical protein ACWD2L_06120 [Streptomyces sp. NPDC002754]
MKTLAAGIVVGFVLAKAIAWAEIRYALADLDARYEDLCCGPCSAFNDEEDDEW